MSGILDSKKRIIDVLLTQEGRKQAASGDLRVESYTFSDAGVYYKPDIASGSADATSRIYFEVANLPQDSITFESNEEGRLTSFNNSAEIQIKDGQIVEFGTSEVGSLPTTTFLKSDEFTTVVDALLNESTENFKKLQVISTKDNLFDDSNFGVGNSNIEFMIHDKKPIPNKQAWSANINHEESLFNDPRLGKSLNFHYLPPVNKISDQSIDKKNHNKTSKFHLGNYPPLGRTQLQAVNFAQLSHELNYFEKNGYSKVVKFDPTSKQNNLMIQFFEKTYNQISKLSVIDYGRLHVNQKSQAHVFFVGKLMVDDFDTHTFVHLFTLIFQ